MTKDEILQEIEKLYKNNVGKEIFCVNARYCNQNNGGYPDIAWLNDVGQSVDDFSFNTAKSDIDDFIDAVSKEHEDSIEFDIDCVTVDSEEDYDKWIDYTGQCPYNSLYSEGTKVVIVVIHLL